MTLGMKVISLRFESGLGVGELARAAGLSRGTLYRIECGQVSRPTPATAGRLARVLGVTVAELLGLAEVPSYPDETSACAAAADPVRHRAEPNAD